MSATGMLELVRAYRNGGWSPVEEVESALCAIAERDGGVQAMLPEPGRAARLRAECARLGASAPADASRLWGVPVGVKDIYHVGGLPTRAGSALPPEVLTGEEGPVIRALRSAGALILGKTVTTEFAYFEPGPTRNPVAPGRTPGGSSSGSAAAVAAGYCPVALGSQTVGSVIRPAAFCGVVGMKTTRDRVSLAGVIPYAPSLDHFGFFVRRAEDLEPVLDLLLPPEETPSAQERPVLAVPVGPLLEEVELASLARFRQVLDRLQEKGCRIIAVEALGDFAAIDRAHQRLAAGEMALAHREWFAAYGDLYRPRTAAWIRAGQEVGELELEAARAGRDRLAERLEAQLAIAGADAWVTPAAPGPPPKGLGSTGNPVMNLPWTYAGVPAAALPAPRYPGDAPEALQMATPRGSDRFLARICVQLGRLLREAPAP